MIDTRVFLFCSAFILTSGYFEDFDTCNQSVCASVVSKCLLTQSCKCELKSCTCCKECYNCLGVLFTECCSCFNLCPKQNTTSTSITAQSHVQDLDGVPGLFAALTIEPDDNDLWTVFTLPSNYDDLLVDNNKNKLDFDINLQIVEVPKNVDNKNIANCTVVYLAQCMSWNKCKESCQSMGANSLRWFHDGCCECVGSMCLNYGVNESRCSLCPEEEDEDLLDDDYEYGEVMDQIGYGF